MTRTGDVGNCYEYGRDGRRLPGTDRMTIDGMIALSRKWPDTYHQYMDPNGRCVVWAKDGREIAAPAFAR